MPSDKFGAPFPCQSHACGCRSAAACWADCCCFTPEQKLAWARANGITPPVGTPTFDPETKRSASDDEAPPTKRSCCATKAAAPAASQPSQRACCGARKASCCEASRTERTDDEAGDADEEATGIVLLEAMQCRGVATSWTGTGQPFLPAPAIEWTPEISVAAMIPAPQIAFASRRLRYVGPPG